MTPTQKQALEAALKDANDPHANGLQKSTIALIEDALAEPEQDPQPREWQELSEDELAYAVESARCEAFPGGAPKRDLTHVSYKHISAALRAKNGG